ncbi:T9SS type B sorting domain-containing protein, partial [Mesohalobacter halotolerans]|uniref:T9SS type B sorting domain-containing protein n=1 Tax=Mesohalobacter halotolerans TaxID=1883405 RepID=UPI001FE82238
AEVVNTQTLCESSSFVSFDVIVNPLPNVDISGFDGAIVCIDEEGNTINTDDSPPILDTGLDSNNFTFEWAFNGTVLPATSPSIDATQAGTYTVTVTNINTGCQAMSSAEIIESNPPTFEVTVLTPSFSETHVVEVSNIEGQGNFEFQLDNGPWESLAPGQTTLVFSNVIPGTHIIRGRDDAGCGVTAVEFTMIDFPPFFTPNQDGVNETWNITGLSNQPNAKIYIFDRYGKLLKQLSPTGEGWDGTFNGSIMPSQDYWFRVEFIEPTTGNPSTFKSHFTLKR